MNGRNFMLETAHTNKSEDWAMNNSLNQIMRSYAEWLIHHRMKVIVIIVMLTIFLGYQLTKLELENSPDIWQPQDHPIIKTTRLLERIFGGRNYTIIGITPKNGDVFQPAILTKVYNIQRGIEKIPGAVRHNIMSLAAKNAKAITGSQEGMEVHQMMERVPQTPKDIDRLRRDIENNPIYQKAIISADGKSVAITADFRVNEENANYTTLFDAIKKVVDKERDEQVDIYVGGLPYYLSLMEYYMMQMPAYFGVALLIIIVIQYLSFRTLQGMFLPTVTAVLSVVWALGFMGLRGMRLDAMNMNTPILIMAVTAGHAIQILKRYYEEYRKLRIHSEHEADRKKINNAAIIESIAQVGPIMIMAGFIAVVVFYSLKFTSISMTRRFGEFAATGILAGLITELTLIPTLRSFLKAPKLRSVDRENRSSLLDRMLTSLSNALIGEKSVILLAVSAGLILLVFSGVLKIRKDDSLKQYYAPGTELRKDDAALNKTFAGTDSIALLVEGKESDSLKDPDVLRGMVALQTFLNEQANVGKTQSIADLIKRMNRAMHGDDAAYDKIPDSRELVAQYLLLYSSSGDPQDFDSFVDSNYQKAVIWVYLKTDSTAYTVQLYAKAQRIIAENFPKDITVRIGGSVPQAIAMDDVVIEEKLYNILQMGVVLFFLSSLILRSFVGGLFVVTPLIAVVMTNFGILGWFNIPLDVGSALAATLAIAIGADYELYLMFRLKEELAKTQNLKTALHDSFITAGKAIILAALSVAGGYSILLISDFGFYPRFATVVIATMVVSSLSAIVLLRSMMMVFKPRFIFGEQRDAYFALRTQEQKEKQYA